MEEKIAALEQSLQDMSSNPPAKPAVDHSTPARTPKGSDDKARLINTLEYHNRDLDVKLSNSEKAVQMQ